MPENGGIFENTGETLTTEFNMIIRFFIVIVVCFAATAILARLLIPTLKSLKVGQKIREIGPRWHKSKEGTPILGGIFFIIPIMLTMIFVLIFRIDFSSEGKKLLFSMLLAFLCGMIGFTDDMIKIVKKRNEGLRASEKFLLQLIVAALYLFFMARFCGLSTSVYFPFIGKTINFGKLYYVFALILIVGIVNSVNLTDGVDGLASSVTAAVCAFFAVYAISLQNEGCFYLAGAVFGGCFGFLVYNLHPAKVFMGDTGSLFLGGAVCAMAFLVNNPLVIICAGLVYVIESLSDIIQVIYFKLTHGKRLFKMAPIHHHFERCGWSENKIVSVFTLITAAVCVLTYIFG